MTQNDPKKALHAYLALKKRADAGDPVAKAEMTKLAGNPLAVQALRSMAADAQMAAALTVLPEEEVVGVDEPGGGVIAEDDIEQADWLARKYANADSLTQKVAQRSANWQQLNSVAPFQRINPPTALQGTLGGQQAITTESSQQLALWGGVDAETLPVTITYGIVARIPDPVRIAPGFGLRPYAIIKFGTRGFLLEAEVDIGLGFQMTVNASYVSLQAALDDTGNEGPVQISGMLSFYPCVRTAPLTRTHYATVANGTTTEARVMPPFAKNVVLRRDDPTIDVTVDLLDSNGATRDSFELAAAATGSDMVVPVPLMGEIVAYKVTNGGASPVNVGLVFGLSL